MTLTDEQGLQLDIAYFNCPEVHNPEFTEDEHAAAEIGFEAGYKAALSAQPAKPATTEERVIELARQAGALKASDIYDKESLIVDAGDLIRFAALIAAEGSNRG